MESSTTFYRDRPDWADVTPIKQDAVERNVCKIAYSEAFIDAYDYLRAVMSTDERSLRALSLTDDCLNLNPANYSAWAYRRNIIESINHDLNLELRTVSAIMESHPKNYQVWHHRQWVLQKLCEDADEKEVEQLREDEVNFILSAFGDDSKNYHAWQHFTWAAKHFKLPAAQQLNLTESLILADALNNSAWSFRFYVVKKEGLDDKVMNRVSVNSLFSLGN